MTPTLLDLALKAGFSDPIEGWMGEAYEERLEAFAKFIIEHEAAKWYPYGSLDEMTRDLKAEIEASNRMLEELEALKAALRLCQEAGLHKYILNTGEKLSKIVDSALVTRTAATKIRKYEPTIDLGKYAGTYGGYIKESEND